MTTQHTKALVLVVTSEEHIGEFIKLSLIRAGFDVVIALDGTSAIKWLSESWATPSAIVTIGDIEFHGQKAVEWLTENGFGNVPTLFIVPPPPTEIFGEPVFDMCKPLDPKVIVDWVREVVQSDDGAER